MGERVHVLNFRAGSKRFLPFGADGNVDIAAQRAFLHFAVGNPDVPQDHLKGLHILLHFVDAAQIGFRDNLDQRNAAAVIVDVGVAAVMNQLARIFLDVDAVEADPAAVRELHPAVFAQRHVILGNLVGFRQIRINVIFPVHLRNRADLAVSDKACRNGVFHHGFIQLGQRARKADADRAAVGVRLPAELG